MNAPADFQGNIKNAIWEVLDDIALAYKDDIVICSNCEKEYFGHLKWVKKCLLDAGWYLKLEKCKLHNETVRYLQQIISTKRTSMDEAKSKKVRNWCMEKMANNAWLNNMLYVHQFLGFCNDYPLFISKYSEKAEPLQTLANKNEPFIWVSEQ